MDFHGRSGGLVLLWKNQRNVTLLSFSKNHINVVVHVAGFGGWPLMGVYGEPLRSARHRT